MYLPLLENLIFIINDMKSEIVNRAHYPRKPGSLLNEKFKSMAKKAFGGYISCACIVVLESASCYCNILLPVEHLSKVFSISDQQIAGHTTEFVREVLQEVARGNKSGGLVLPDAQRS